MSSFSSNTFFELVYLVELPLLFADFSWELLVSSFKSLIISQGLVDVLFDLELSFQSCFASSIEDSHTEKPLAIEYMFHYP